MNRLRRALALIRLRYILAVYTVVLFLYLLVEFLATMPFLAAAGTEPTKHGLLNIWLTSLSFQAIFWLLIKMIVTGLLPFLVLLANPSQKALSAAILIWGTLLVGATVLHAHRVAEAVDLLISTNKPPATTVQPNLGTVGEVTIGALLAGMDGQPSSSTNLPSIFECEELTSFIESRGRIDFLQISDTYIILESGGESRTYDFSADGCIERE